ncbi:hypothetical protein [Aliikangiella coralliicola]|uniref:Uncharacterized protein n=1 Tax=Aliikangiella coralliicola TaxID=2592383 RepID=A0A545UJB0_9GAMM|nr:hypothetical protein [Aliikangiella coralliicola]TQV89549.1 hypothetical protein FLL46_01305 [Aliikangiella coralliicola]
MKTFIKAAFGIIAILFFSSGVFAKNYLKYARNTSDSVLRGNIIAQYTRVMDPTSCQFSPTQALASRGDQCEPTIEVVPPSSPEIHYFANDALNEVIKYRASKSANGLLIVRQPLNAKEKELSRIVKEGRAKVAQNLRDFEAEFEAENGGNKPVPKAKMVISDGSASSGPDCTQGEASELMDSSLDALKNEVDIYIREQIKAGNIPVYSEGDTDIKSLSLGVSFGRSGIGGSAGVQLVFNDNQFTQLSTSDGGLIYYSFSNGQPYLNLERSLTPPRGALNGRAEFSKYFSRNGNWGPYKRVGENIVDEKDSCFFQEMEAVMQIIATPIVDKRGANAGFAGQCVGGAFHNGDMVTFNYWTQSATWNNSVIVISMKKVTVTVNRSTYSSMCR